MYLSKLKIFGFKSFAQKVEVQFPGNGLTAVVGPNGCGKSNIVDAIRWVMGEQRASQLRSSKMQDVIFSGTEDRPPLNMAEVSLVINNDRGLLPSEFTEIQITRRAYRNGDMEYLLNNQECRLKDIQNLFYDTGMGAASYSLMEQRMIDAILSDKAEDRRVLFEEAAGVSKYKQQRKETLRQLEKVSQDMERIEDNLRHVRSSVKQHERQVQRAEEWHRLRNRLRALEISMSLDQYEENRGHLETLSAALRQLEADRSALQTRLTELETRISEKKLSIAADEEAYRELEAEVGSRHRDLSALNAEYSAQKSKLESLQAAIARSEREIELSLEQALILRNRRDELEQAMSGAEGDEDAEMQSVVERLEESCVVVRDQVEDLRQKQRDLSARHRQLLDQVSRLRGRWDRAEGELSQVEQQLENIRREREGAEYVKRGIAEEIGRCRLEIESLTPQKVRIEERIGDLDVRRHALASALESLKHEEKDAEARLIAIRSRRQVLERMDTEHAGVEGGARWLLAHKKHLLRGILSEHLEVSAEYAALVEFCLGEGLQAVLLEDPGSVSDLLEALSQSQEGRAVLLLPGNTSAEDISFADPAVVGSVARLVRCAAPWDNAVRSLLRPWILVKDLNSALRLAQQHRDRHFWFVTPDRVVVHTAGLVFWGGRDGCGLLSRRLELEEARQAERVVSGEVENIRARRIAVESENAEMERELGALQEEINQLLRNEQELMGNLRILEARFQGVQGQLERMEQAVASWEQRRAALEGEKQGDQELRNAEAELRGMEQELERGASILEERERYLRGQEEDLREARQQLVEWRAKRGQAVSQMQSLREQESLHQSIVATRREEIEKLQIDVGRLKESLEALAALIELRSEELTASEAKRDLAKERYAVMSGDIDAWHDEIRSIHAVLREKDAQSHEIQRRVDALRLNQERAKERIFETWEFDLDHPGDFARVEYEEKDALREIRDLKEQLKRLGPVSATVMEDYEKEKANLAEVEKQFEDLDRARSSLQRTIERLDRIARERFLETFRQIQKNFQDVFSSLMVGGEGRLTLQEGVDPLEAEIEVNARPTGKKMRGVRALSGGERALTATSLLFALYMVKPSPYCILDEVDGPLDDANIGRFVQLLRRFSRQTQFIIVTHNKRTMAACDMLYGVTQEIKGISRIASVELNEAQELVK